MSISAFSYFHRFWIINSIIAAVFGCLFIFLCSFAISTTTWDIFYSGITLFGILSLGLYYWKSWKYSIIDPSFSALKAGLKISLSWMFVWDISLLGETLIEYFKNPNICSGLWGSSPCSFWERIGRDFGTTISIGFMLFLFVLPILFSITGFYLDKRNNKATFPWGGVIIFILMIVAYVGSEVFL